MIKTQCVYVSVYEASHKSVQMPGIQTTLAIPVATIVTEQLPKMKEEAPPPALGWSFRSCGQQRSTGGGEVAQRDRGGTCRAQGVTVQ